VTGAPPPISYVPVLLGLVVALVAAGQAQGHDAFIRADTPDTWNTDNLLRWGMANATLTTVKGYRNFTPETNPLEPSQIGPLVSILSRPCPEVVSGCSGTGGAADLENGWGSFCGRSDGLSPYCPTSTNAEWLNYTWAEPVPATNWRVRMICMSGGGCQSSVTFQIRFEAYDADLNVVASASQAFSDRTCATSPFLNVSKAFDRVLIKGVRIYVNTTNSSGACNIYPGGISVWSSGRQDDAVAYTSKYLEYADFLTTKVGWTTGNRTAAVTLQTYLPMIVGPGESIGYFAHTNGRGSSLSESCTWSARPNVTGSPGVSAKMIGVSTGSNGLDIGVWKITNTNPYNSVIQLSQGANRGFSISTCRFPVFDDTSAFFKHAPGPAGTAYTLSEQGTIPVKVSETELRLVPLNLGVVYNATQAPFSTISAACSTCFNSPQFTDVDHAVPVATGIGNTVRTFYINLTPYSYYGNFLMFHLADVGPDQICDQFSPRVTTLRGNVPLPPVLFAPLDRVGGSHNFYGCWWALDDFSRTNGISYVGGQNQYFDNSWSGFQRRYQVTIQEPFPDTERLPSAALGSQFYAIQRMDGNGSLYIQCTNSLMICYGNIDTTTTQIPGEVRPAYWNWRVVDDATNSNLEGATVHEQFSGTFGSTDSAGRVSLTTYASSVKWVISQGSHIPASLNITDLCLGCTYNITVALSKTKPHQTMSCTQTNATAFFCNMVPSGGNIEACEEWDGNTMTCSGEGDRYRPKTIMSYCPINKGTQQPISKASVVDAVSGYATILAQANGTSCAPSWWLSGATVNVTYEPDTASCLFGLGAFILTHGSLVWGCSSQTGTHTYPAVPSAVSLTASKAGFRSLRLALDTTPYDFIEVDWFMLGGDGLAAEGDVSVQFVNTTIAAVSPLDGVTRSARHGYIVVTDRGVNGTGRAPGSVISPGTGTGGSIIQPDGSISLESGLRSFGSLFGLTDALWGLVLFVAALLFTVTAATSITRDPKVLATLAAVVAVPAFFVIALLGLWPLWLVVTVAAVVLLVAGLGLYAKVGRAGGAE
jgi:hypothetical protein